MMGSGVRVPASALAQRLGDREGETEGRARARGALHLDLRAVRLGDDLGDREAEPAAGDRLLDRVRAAEEAVEEVALLGAGDAGPGVHDLEGGGRALDA